MANTTVATTKSIKTKNTKNEAGILDSLFVCTYATGELESGLRIQEFGFRLR